MRGKRGAPRGCRTRVCGAKLCPANADRQVIMEMDVRVITLGMILLAMSTQPTRAQVLDRPSSTEPRAWISALLTMA
jgi:hypothetical protein